RLRSNCTVMRDWPSEVTEVSSLTPEISPTLRSIGAATVAAMILGSAPGRLAVMLMVGNSTLGRLATGRKKEATAPTRNNPIAIRVGPIGRRTKGEEKFTAGPGRDEPRGAPAGKRTQIVHAGAPCKGRSPAWCKASAVARAAGHR